MSQENKKIAELKEKLSLFYDKVGALTKVQRVALCIVTFALIGGAYYYFILMPRQETLKQVKQTLESQKKKLAIFKQQASQLAKYEKMMAAAQAEFNQAMQALPDKRELPSLLTGISRAGGDAGLLFHLFKPEAEIKKEFFKEIPVSIKVEGRYHQLTDFFYQIIRLNRIVNIHNVTAKMTKSGQKLEMNCRAVTYMFVEKDESENKQEKRKKKK
jgi:type IV pilus assembly protein PilO